MNRRGKVILAASMAVSFAGLAAFLFWPREPIYQGRKLGSWLQDFEADALEKRALAAHAVKAIGPRAVPFLVERLKSPNPNLRKETRFERWKRTALEWLSRHSSIKVAIGPRHNPRRQALAGLDALGPEAKDALPALEGLLREAPPDPAALYVVARIGPAGMPLITRMLTNEVKVLRLEARVCVEMVRTHSETLYADIGFGPDASTFESRICQFNLKTMHAALEEYKTQHPEMFSADGRPLPSLPPELVDKMRERAASRTTNQTRRAAGPSAAAQHD